MEKAHESIHFLRRPASSMILLLDSTCSTAEELADMINDFSQYFIDEIKCSLAFSYNSELKKKFYTALKIINLRKVEEFVKAIQVGASDEYLANLSYLDKCSLSTHILLLGEDFQSAGIRSEEEKQQCFSIITDAIKKDFEEDIAKYGLNSADWEKYFSSHQTISIPEQLSEIKVQSCEVPFEKVKKEKN